MIVGVLCYCGAAHDTYNRTATPPARDTEHILADRHPEITYRPISFSATRTELTLEYIHRHVDPERDHLRIEPRLVVIHWTATVDFESAFRIFDRETAHPARRALYEAGHVNVAVQFMIDRDGRTVQLMPANRFARHCIGLNHISIGVENIGGPHMPLTDAQLQANIKLIQILKEYYPIEMVIGHQESGLLKDTEYYQERNPDYFVAKPDPGLDFMRRLRSALQAQGMRLRAPTSESESESGI